MESNSTNGWHQTSLAQFHTLADRYGTPYFLYDADDIVKRIESVRESLERLVEVFYAVKANPNLELLRVLRGSADGLDISSVGELEQAVLAGFETGKISFAGPAKTLSELTESIHCGIGCISVESSRELTECIGISRQAGRKANIVVRVNPQFLNRSYGMKMSGRATQFGIDEEDLGTLFSHVLANTETLEFRGIHIYAGSQCFEPAGIVAGVQNCLSIACQIEARTGLVCRVINLGGGFGVSHTEEGHELDLKALARDLVPILREFHNRTPVERKIIFELGRFLTAEAGIYVTRVISSKESRGKAFFMVDGGLHHHLAAAGSFGAAFRANFLLRNLSRPEAPKMRCSIAGPSCNPTDLLGIDVELPRPEIGDLIAVLKSGSYGFTASPLLFLGRQTPAELICRHGEVIVGRRPRTIVDFN
jgi:diaminopimelate decarboxylase